MRKSARVAYRKHNERLMNLKPEQRKKLKEVEGLAKKFMSEHGVDHLNFMFGFGWTYLGKCTTKSIIIQLNHALTSDLDKLKNTILHEIAHALVPPNSGHREVWQKKAKELGVSWKRKYRK